MKKFLTFVLIMAAANAQGGVSIGGGSGSSKTALDPGSVTLSIDRLPEIRVSAETLRRAEARLSVDGVESVQISLDNSSVTVRKLNSSIVDIEITRKFMPQQSL